MPTGHQDFDPIPSVRRSPRVIIAVRGSTSDLMVGHLSSPGQGSAAGFTADQLAQLGFSGSPGQTLLIPASPPAMLVGVGAAASVTAEVIRDAAGTFAAAAPRHPDLGIDLPPSGRVTIAAAVDAAIEGAVLARYRFSLKSREDPDHAFVQSLTLFVDESDRDQAEAAVPAALVRVAAAELGRDLANSPGGLLTATRMADIAVELGTSRGLTVEVFDKEALIELGCGGLLGVNLGSSEPPRMIKLSYRPAAELGAPTGSLALVAKGIMYDSGGISLKPSDAVHATMKNDMSGAAATLAAITALPQLGCRTAVTAWLMCTDNMPSGTAMKLGDVITIRGGTTVEVLNTDAEGRLVMADALVLATEESHDALVDIASLTGACLRALGPEVAGVMGTSQAVIDQVKAAAERVDEPVWQFPMVQRYRAWMDTDIADIANLGGVHAGQITAALFMAEFVGDLPWAHIDIAGTAWADSSRAWRSKGATGFGTRLLIDLALNFTVPTAE